MRAQPGPAGGWRGRNRRAQHPVVGASFGRFAGAQGLHTRLWVLQLGGLRARKGAIPKCWCCIWGVDSRAGAVHPIAHAAFGGVEGAQGRYTRPSHTKQTGQDDA
eukprot:30011-Chlamydomonas_euryale.AAC.8